MSCGSGRNLVSHAFWLPRGNTAISYILNLNEKMRRESLSWLLHYSCSEWKLSSFSTLWGRKIIWNLFGFPVVVYGRCLTICSSLAVYTDVNRNQFWGKKWRAEGSEGCLGSSRDWACQLDKVIFPAAVIRNKVSIELYVGPVLYFITRYGTSTKLIQVYTEVSIPMNRFAICRFYNNIYKSIFLLSHMYLFL